MKKQSKINNLTSITSITSKNRDVWGNCAMAGVWAEGGFSSYTTSIYLHVIHVIDVEPSIHAG